MALGSVDPKGRPGSRSAEQSRLRLRGAWIVDLEPAFLRLCLPFLDSQTPATIVLLIAGIVTLSHAGSKPGGVDMKIQV